MRSKTNRKGQLEALKSQSAQAPSSLTQIGVFCEFFGNTIHNQVLEYILEHEDLDFAASDVASWLGISRPKAYEYLYLFAKKKMVVKTRIVGGTQLYSLDASSIIVKKILRVYAELLKK